MPAPVEIDDDPDLLLRLAELGLLAESLPSSTHGAWRLQLFEGRVALAPVEPEGSLRGAQPLFVAFSEGSMGFRLARAEHEAVVKAVRGKKRNIHTVIDGTAGMGRDAFILAAVGFEVTMVESSPWVHALLADGLDRLSADGGHDELAARLTLHFGTAEQVLPGLAADLVYLDPMFPPTESSQKTGKEMQVLHEVVGPPVGERTLLDAALQVARFKVVVKRPRRAPPLAGVRPASELPRKTSRFDVYPVP